jgi:hypothetical protein
MYKVLLHTLIRIAWLQMQRVEAQNRVATCTLRDAFGMHEVRKDNCEPEVVVQGSEEIVNEEAVKGDELKYYDLLKKAKKPFHRGTKHSKLSGTIHLYIVTIYLVAFGPTSS